jgi:hypothetical protein
MALLSIFRGRPSSLTRSLVLWSVAGLSLAAQFYATFYLGWFLVLVLGLAGLWGLVLPECRPVLVAVVRDQWPAIACAAAATSLAIYPLLGHYLETAKQVGMRSDIAIAISIPYWETWFYEGPHRWVWGWLHQMKAFHFLNLEWEQRAGIGLVTPLVCVAGLVLGSREPVVRLVALTMLSLLMVVTRFEREFWEGAGLGLWVVFAVELLRGNRMARERQLVGCLMVVWSLTLFLVQTLAQALLLAALPYGASRFLSDRSRRYLSAIASTILIGFPCVTAYADRPRALVAGVVVAAVIEATAWRAGRRPALQTLAVASAIIGGSLWYFQGGIIYWHIVADLVPAARALRAVSRGLLVGLIPAALGLACYFDQKWTSPKRLAAASALGLACLLEQGVTTPSTNKSAWRTATSELARQVDRRCSTFYYSPHDPQLEINEYHVDAMWAQIETGVPTINGYSGVTPPGWHPLYYSGVYAEQDINRLGRALGQWAAGHRLQPGKICWIGGRNDAIVRAEKTAPDDRRPAASPP